MDEQWLKMFQERNELLGLLTKFYPAHVCRPTPGTESVLCPWIVCIHFPTGQCTWHITEKQRETIFKHLIEQPNHWDGHTTAEKYRRLAQL